MIKLPDPTFENAVPLERVIRSRRSTRSFCEESLDLNQISILLHAGQGISEAGSLRTVPSAGAIYPLELYVVASRVTGLERGVYRFIPEKHSLEPQTSILNLDDYARALLGQSFVQKAPVSIVIGASFHRMRSRYRERADRYIFMEAGAAAENIHLQCESLELGTVIIGAFYDSQLQQLLSLPEKIEPLIVMPVGKPF
jgi:SagB-type dehydrogenase family enzyme